MAFNLENMTVSYKSLLKLVPTQRSQLAQSGSINDIISVLSPGQLVSLFPRYYREQLPDLGKVNQYSAKLDVALSGGSKLSSSKSGEVTTYGGGDSGGGGSRKALTPEEKAVQEIFQKAFPNQVGSEATSGIIDSNGRVISTASINMSPQERALLDTIAHGESPNYNTIVDGATFGDFSDHPRQFGTVHTDSTAAGRYQFTKTTWDGTVAEYNKRYPDNKITDFSPENQDRAALYLAQKDYRSRTGRDLQADLNSPPENFGELLKAGLGGGPFAGRKPSDTTWQAFQNMTEDKIQGLFESNYERNVGYVEEMEATADQIVAKFEPEMISQLNQRLQNWYSTASDAQRKKFEKALEKLGTEQFNEVMENQPINSPTLDAVATDGSSLNQRITIDEDVMMGRKPFIEGNDFAVPIYTNAKNGKRFDENLEKLTPEARERLKQQAIAAKAAGLTRLELSGAQTEGHGHVSHGAGTETDTIGYNEDGSKWNSDQRAITALGAVKAGADRAGLYINSKTLHMGKTNEAEGGPTVTGAWGPGGTSDVPIENFAPGLERDVAAYLKGIGPMPESAALNDHYEAMRKMQEVQLKAQEVAQAQETSTAVASTTVPPEKFAEGGNFKVPPKEDIVAKSLKTGEDVFYANSGENIKITPPGTIENKQQMPATTQEDVKNLETPTQAINTEKQPVYRESPDPDLYNQLTGNYYVPPSQLRATNRARLQGDDSSSMINNHFS
jgi:muramidase (phage lysozyme)